MKKLVTVFCMAMMGIGLYAQPQGMPSAEERAKHQTERLKTELSLTADQEKKVYDLYLASGKKMEEARKSSGKEDRDAIRTKMEESRKEQDAKLKTILTSSQYTKYQELQKKWEAERQQRKGNGPEGQR
ncbi:MAG: hypothetical protein QM786_00195 [Breznakibacter sp.]